MFDLINTNAVVFISAYCFSDQPQHSSAVPQDKEEESIEEDVYEYDCPRPVIPPAPTRRTLSDMGGPAAAFSTLSIDSAVEASTSF